MTEVVETVDVDASSEQLELTELQRTDIAIADMCEQYGSLTITDVNDKKQVKAVVDAHVIVKKCRVQIDKTRKAMNAPFQARIDAHNAEGKRLKAKVEELEGKLFAEREKFESEKRRKKEEAERLERERLQSRVDQLAGVGAEIKLDVLKEMSDEQFDAALAQETVKHNKRKIADGVRDQLATFGRTVLLEDLVDCDAGEHQKMLQDAKADYEAEQARLKTEREQRERIEEENRQQQERIQQLEAEVAARNATVNSSAESPATEPVDSSGETDSGACCESFVEALLPLSVSEIFGSAIEERDGDFFIGDVSEPIRFCPWCGQNKECLE